MYCLLPVEPLLYLVCLTQKYAVSLVAALYMKEEALSTEANKVASAKVSLECFQISVESDPSTKSAEFTQVNNIEPILLVVAETPVGADGLFKPYCAEVCSEILDACCFVIS